MAKIDDIVSDVIDMAKRFKGKPITRKSLEQIIGEIRRLMGEHISGIEPYSFWDLISSNKKDPFGLEIFMELDPCGYYLVLHPKSREAIRFAKKRIKAWHEWLSRKSKSKDESQESHGKTKNKENENG